MYYFKFHSMSKQCPALSRLKLQTLGCNQIYISSLNELNDPFEDYWYGRNVDIYKDDITIDNVMNPYKGQEKEKLLAIHHWKVFCMSGCSDESFINKDSGLLMWSHYADAHHGYCLQYNSEKFNEIEKDLKSLNLRYHLPSSVIYSDEIPDFNNRNQQRDDEIHRILRTKSQIWEYEKEYRLCVHASKMCRLSLPAGTLRAIYCGVNMPANDIRILQGIAEKLGAECKKMTLDSKYFRLKPIKI